MNWCNLPGSPRGYAHVFIVLVRDDEEANRIRRGLGDHFAGQSVATVVIPPVRGIQFFADSENQDGVDAWWAANVPPGSTPVYLLDEDEAIEVWAAGLDGIFYVGDRFADADATAEFDRSIVRRVRIVTAVDLIGTVVRDFARATAQVVRAFAEDSPDSSLQPSLTALNQGSTAFHGEGGSRESRPASVPTPLHPFDLLARLSAPANDLPMSTTHSSESSQPAAPSTNTSLPLAMRLPAWTRRVPWRLERRQMPDASLAAMLCERGNTVVAIGSRKGGVGKTSHAAGVAIVAGQVLDSVGHQAAILDANIANPDAWGQLALPSGAATVRDVAAALSANREPVRPVYASTPALACYPESRESSEYSRTDVARIADYLRSRYTLVVVDMSNRLPDPSAGPEAAVAAFWLEESDVLVLPTASSKQDFNGVLDYLELRALPTAIVAYLLPRTRRNRDHPLTKRYMAAIAQRAWRVVSLPDDAERVRYAGMEGVPVQNVSSEMRAAYRDLTEAIAMAPRRDRRLVE